MRFSDTYDLLKETRLYEEDLAGLGKLFTSQDKDDNAAVKLFKIKTEPKKRGPHHRRDHRGINRKHQNWVPDVHKPDPSLNYKIETLRKGPGKQILTLPDINYIVKTYKINRRELTKSLTRDKPKFLGTSNIKIYYDHNNHCFCLEKE